MKRWWLLALFAGSACGTAGFPPAPTLPWTVGQGWTATPLDEALAIRAAECRVRVRTSADGRPSEESERTTSSDGARRSTITRRSDGSLYARAVVEREGARLEVLLEIPDGASLDAETVASYPVRPNTSPPPHNATMVRTFELRRGGEGFVLGETGAREPSERDERYEGRDGIDQWRRSGSPEQRVETRAHLANGVRRSELRASGSPDYPASTATNIEELGAGDRIMREREIVVWGDEPPREQVTELQYHARSRLAARASRRGQRATLSIEYDDAGRPIHLTSSRPREVRVTYDSSGRLERETVELTGDTWSLSRLLERTYDARGRLIRSRVVERTRRMRDEPTDTSQELDAEYSYDGCGDGSPAITLEPGHEGTFETPLDLVP